MSETGTINTGPVRASSYAMRFRRAAHAAVRAHPGVPAPALNAEVARANRAMYRVLVDAMRVPKSAVVLITATLSVDGGDPKIADVHVDILRRDDALSDEATRAVAAEMARA